MELEEAIKNVRKFNQENRYRDCGKINNSIDMVLQALENSIPKEKVEDKIEIYKRLEMESFDRDSIQADEYRAIIKVLQELLEE